MEQAFRQPGFQNDWKTAVENSSKSKIAKRLSDMEEIANKKLKINSVGWYFWKHSVVRSSL
jgi:hypothetical protein